MDSNFNIYPEYHDMETEGTLVSFKGIVTKDLLNSLCQVIDEKLDAIDEETKIRRKVYNILVETLQNVFHHVENGKDSGEDKSIRRDSLFMIRRNGPGNYSVISGNFVRNVNIDALREKIEYVNSLTPQDLRDHYVNSLSKTEFSEKGGAGLGIIDIARKSGNKLGYTFEKISDELSFFTLVITVSTNNYEQ